ncbi:MAG: E3 ubiquitin protein ligase [Candidatus Lokiarchaeota archaeon]|nr:E3 ubiquitin protein ligase [Candidatus Lokiarchaeota archaeon]
MDLTDSSSLKEAFDQLKFKLENLINSKKKTSNSLDPKSQPELVQELIDYSQSISVSLLENFTKEFDLFSNIGEVVKTEPPSYLSAILTKNLITRFLEFNAFNTLIRSARKITKKNQLSYNFQIIMQKLLEGYQKTAIAIKDHQSSVLKDRKDVIPSSIKLEELDSFIYYEPVEFISSLGSSAQKWYTINLEKATKYTINASRNSLVQYIFPTIQKSELSLQELQKSSDVTKITYNILKILKKQDLTEEFNQIVSELLWVYFRVGIIQEVPHKIIVKDSKAALKRLISNAYFEIVTELFQNTKYEDIIDEPMKILSKIALLCENDIQAELSKLNLPADKLEEKYNARISPLLKKLNIIGAWLKSLKPFLKPYENVTAKFEEIVEDLIAEILRKQEEFENYSDIVYEHDTRATVEKELDSVLQLLNDKISSYQKTTLKLVEEEIPQINQISEIIKNFQQEFDKIYVKAQHVFQKYQKENVNIYDAIQRWEETYFAEKHRAEFIITKLLTTLVEKFQILMKKEEGFMEPSSEFGSDERKLSLMLSPNILNPDTLTDEQIRNQMQYIDKKLKDLERMKHVYTNTKISYKALLEKRLEKKGDIKSKICVICHKKVDVVSEDYIKCEFCGRLSHYLCSAWWLEKHNSCPVCGNVYLVPGSELYDSDKVEK